MHSLMIPALEVTIRRSQEVELMVHCEAHKTGVALGTGCLSWRVHSCWDLKAEVGETSTVTAPFYMDSSSCLPGYR